MAGRGNLFSREHFTGDNFETNFPKRPSPQGKVNPKSDVPEYLYPVSNEVVDHLRRITRLYATNLGGFLNIPNSPRRQTRRKECRYTKQSVLVGDFEELVDLTLQEIVQPLNQLGPESPNCSPF